MWFYDFTPPTVLLGLLLCPWMWAICTKSLQCQASAAIVKKQYEKAKKKKALKDELPRSVDAQYATGDHWRKNSRKNEGMEPKQKQYPALDVTGDGSKVRCYKEQYCIGTWNVSSMKQGKLEVVKQEMAKVNIDILGTSKWKWTGMGEFNSDDHYISYCG